MKYKLGLVSNSSNTTFILKDITSDINDFQNRLMLFLECGMLCGYIDTLWENKLRNELECYLQNGKIVIECYQMPFEVQELLRLIFTVEEEGQW